MHSNTINFPSVTQSHQSKRKKVKILAAYIWIGPLKFIAVATKFCAPGWRRCTKLDSASMDFTVYMRWTELDHKD